VRRNLALSARRLLPSPPVSDLPWPEPNLAADWAPRDDWTGPQGYRDPKCRVKYLPTLAAACMPQSSTGSTGNSCIPISSERA